MLARQRIIEKLPKFAYEFCSKRKYPSLLRTSHHSEVSKSHFCGKLAIMNQKTPSNSNFLCFFWWTEFYRSELLDFVSFYERKYENRGQSNFPTNFKGPLFEKNLDKKNETKKGIIFPCQRCPVCFFLLVFLGGKDFSFFTTFFLAVWSSVCPWGVEKIVVGKNDNRKKFL